MSVLSILNCTHNYSTRLKFYDCICTFYFYKGNYLLMKTERVQLSYHSRPIPGRAAAGGTSDQPTSVLIARVLSWGQVSRVYTLPRLAATNCVCTWSPNVWQNSFQERWRAVLIWRTCQTGNAVLVVSRAVWSVVITCVVYNLWSGVYNKHVYDWTFDALHISTSAQVCTSRVSPVSPTVANLRKNF